MISVYTVADLLTVGFETLYLFLLFETFLNRKTHVGQYIYYPVAGCTFICIWLSNIITNINFVNVLLMMAIGFIASLFYDGSFRNHILLPVIGIMVSAFSEILTLFAMSLLFNVDVVYIETGYMRIIGMIISKIFGYIVIKYITYRFPNKSQSTNAAHWVLYFFMFLSVTLIMLTFCRVLEDGTSEFTSNLIILCSFGISITTIIILYLYELNLQQEEELVQQRLSQTELENQVKHYNDLMMSQEELRSVKHDLKNHMLSIKAYIADGENIRAEEYINSLLNSTFGQESYFNTGNTVLDALFGVKKNEAERAGIQFTSNICIPSGLPIEAADVCIIFGNLLDNAIEACSRVENSPYISIDLVYGENMLLAKIENSCSYEVNDFTAKEDTHNHGIGKMNVELALKNYNAVLTQDCSDGKYTVSILFTNI